MNRQFFAFTMGIVLTVPTAKAAFNNWDTNPELEIQYPSGIDTNHFEATRSPFLTHSFDFNDAAAEVDEVALPLQLAAGPRPPPKKPTAKTRHLPKAKARFNRLKKGGMGISAAKPQLRNAQKPGLLSKDFNRSSLGLSPLAPIFKQKAGQPLVGDSGNSTPAPTLTPKGP